MTDTPIALSVLDQVPIRAGSDAATAVAETVELARLADRLGYRRYWLAEHHSSEALSCGSPEILVPQLANATERIRVGTGGVMLTHYSPFKVAESFRLLEALFPGRIDLGIGRAPGSDRLTAAALSPSGHLLGPEHYPRQVNDLLGFLHGEMPNDHPFARIRAMPDVETVPEVWLLGSGIDSARIAAHFGCAYSHAHFINPRGSEDAVFRYRQEFAPGVEPAPRASLGVSVVCAESDEEAERLVASRFLWWIELTKGRPGPFPSPEEAERYPYTDGDRTTLEKLRRRSIHGSPETVRTRLEALAAEHEVEELVLLTITHDPEARRRSYELLAEAFGLERVPDRAAVGASTD